MKKTLSLKSVFSSMVLWVAFIVALSIAFILTVTYEATKASVQVTQDGKTELIRTHADTVNELMSELDVTVQQHDELSHNLNAPVEYGMNVDYIQSKAITLVIDEEETKEIYTTASTVQEFLNEEEVDVKEQDALSHQIDANIEDGMEVELDRAIQITFNDGGEKEKVWTTASTVEEFLTNQEVELNPLDELNLNEGEELTAEAPVVLTRVEKVTDIVEEEVEYTVETRKDSSMPKGEERIVSEGEAGLVTKEYEVILKNGEEASRELIEETVEKESKTKIVALGTKVEAPARTASTASRASSSSASSSSSSSSEATTVSRNDSGSSRTLYMHATAYTADCAGCSGITATGINLNANPNMKVVAVDPSVIPLGTRVWVEGYGYAVAGDTGGAINGNRIDVHVASKSQALSFGRRNVQVKILD
ncbi:DUF348 domain-containing protein [Halobacillus fulvus]|nr:DUF348 domain-containing protein [Halobacillus fulvus]